MSKSPNRHYVPEWLLDKFRSPYLHQLNIHTGRVEQRHPSKIGSDPDLWPQDIEDKLSDHDNAAGRIFWKKIRGKSRIELTEEERRGFAAWLACFYVRSPKRLLNIHAHLGTPQQQRQGMVIELYADRAASIRQIRDQNPRRYGELVRQYGKGAADESLLNFYAQYILNAPDGAFPDAKSMRHYYMRNAAVEDYASIILEFDWVWLHSPHGFVIGDDPFLSYHPGSRHWDYGILNPGVEITMPLAVNLCLRLEKMGRGQSPDLIPCDEAQTRQYNCRQRGSAVRFVWGNSPEAVDFINRPWSLD